MVKLFQKLENQIILVLVFGVSPVRSKKPGYYEFECGALTLGEMIYDVCGGMLPGRSLKAVIPGGSSSKILRADERFSGQMKDGTEFDWGIEDIPLDFDDPASVGSMSGSGGIIVMDDTVDMVEAHGQY